MRNIIREKNEKMAHMHPQRIEKHPSNPNNLLSMPSFYHILPPFSYLIKLNKSNISALCYATSEYEVWTIPEEMTLSCWAINKLSLNTRYFVRWDRFRMSDKSSISIGWHQITKHYSPRYESTLAKSPLICGFMAALTCTISYHMLP